MLTRLGQDRYEAAVTPSKFSDHTWSTDSPIRGEVVIDYLLTVGCHQQDILDAFAEADLDFVIKMNSGGFD